MHETAKQHLQRAQTARREGRYTEAKRDLVAAIDLLRVEAPALELAVVIRTLAEVERGLAKPGLARLRYEEAVGLCREAGDARLLAHTLRHLADVAVDLGQLGAAEPYYREALEIYRKMPTTPQLDYANAVRAFAVQQQRSGRREPAAELFREARDIYEATGISGGVAEASARLAELAYSLGDEASAEGWLGKAEAAAERCDDEEVAAYVRTTSAKIRR